MKYRTRPAEVEAVQFTSSSGGANGHIRFSEPMPDWINQAMDRKELWLDASGDYLVIETSDGEVRVLAGDWIVQTATGLCAVKPDVFAANYDPVEIE